MFIVASSMRWAGRMACMGDRRGAYRVLRESERPLGRPKRRWKGNIKTHLKEVG